MSSSQLSSRNRALALTLPTIAAGFTLMVSIAVIAGWLLDVDALTSFSPDRVSMKINTASGFLICAVLLLLAQLDSSPILQKSRWTLEALLLSLGLLTLAQYLFGSNLGIDQLLIAESTNATDTSSPGRMAPTSAIGFLLLACGFLADHWRGIESRAPARVLAAIVLLIAVISLVGHAYGQPAFYLGGSGVTAMALPTALLFAVVALGVFWLHPSSGLPALLSDESLVSSHVRALLIMIICAPLLVGAVVTAGYGRFFEGPLAVAITSLGSVFVAAAVAFVSVIVLRRAESALFVKDRALAAATNGVAISDYRAPDQPIVFVNEAFTKITGYDFDECIGRNCRFLNQGADNPPEIMDEVRTLVANGKSGTVEFRNCRKDGSVFWNRLSLAPIENHEGEITHIVGVLDDITKSKDQGNRLREALDEARVAASMRDTFVHVISHELRTPLNAALTWLRLMELDDRVETRNKGLAIMLQSIDSQSRLIDDLVDISRIAKSGIRLESEEIDARELLESTVEELRPGIEAEHELVVVIEPGDFNANVDAVRLQQIVRNLLNNAAKYTPTGGRIHFRARVEDEHLEITVRDTGKGLTAEQIDQIFEPFWRADASIAGLGVGLSIVHALVKAHGGTIEATSDGPGAGAAFSVRLPTDASPSGHFHITDKSDASVALDTSRFG